MQAIVLALVMAGTTPACGWGADVSTLDSIAARLQRQDSRRVSSAIERLRAWHEDCDATAARQAIQQLRGALQQDRTNPDLISALAIALLRGPDVQLPPFEGVLYRPYNTGTSFQEGTRLLEGVLRRRPDPVAVSELATAALGSRSAARVRAVIQLLERSSHVLPDIGWYWLAELRLRDHDYDGAIAAARRGSPNPRKDRVAAVAKMLHAGTPSSEAASSYIDALHRTTSYEEVAAFYDDLRFLLSEEEISEWGSLHEGRADWIRRQWEWRALSVFAFTICDLPKRSAGIPARRTWVRHCRLAPGSGGVRSIY